MARARALFVIGLVLTAAPALVGQQTSTQQSAPQPPSKTTALIVGRVIDGASGQPIPEAIVTLVPPGGRGLANIPTGASPEIQQALMAAAAASAGSGPATRRVMTGVDGRFLFHSLPPGTFQLTVSLTGYTGSLGVNLTPALAGIMSGVQLQQATTPVTLREGEAASGVTLRLWKFGVISGTVLDDAGEPAIGLMVQVARKVMTAGRVRYVPAWSAKTDDRGLYRISSVVPGDYLVAVPQAQVSMPTAIMTGLMESMTQGPGSAGAGFALMDLMSSGVMPTESMTGGVRIGDYMVASSGSVPLAGPDGRLLAYQTTFYPGASVPAQASVVTLGSGEERSDINFQLRLIPTVRVSGTAMGPDGPVANLGIKLVVPGDGTISESEFDVATAITKADGSFAFYGVPPGQFLLRAQKQPRPPIPAEALANNPAAQMMFSGAAPTSNDMLFAVAPIAVSGADLDGVALQLAKGFRVSGRIEFESQAGRGAPAPAQLQAMSVNLTPVDGRLPTLLAAASPDRPNPQGEFQTKGYQPGKYFLTTTGLAGWQLKSAIVGGRDVLDVPLEIRDADVSGTVLTYVDRVGSVTGTVRSPGEQDLSETVVLIFPQDHVTWIANGMNPRRGRSVRASRTGAFTMPNVPPGDYFVVAIDRTGESDLQDPARVTALSKLATRAAVASEALSLELVKVRVNR